MKIRSLLLTLLLSSQASAQEPTAPTLAGWQPLRSSAADLDGDGATDLAVVYRALDPSKRVPTSFPFCDEIDLSGGQRRFLVDQNPRKLVVYLQRAQQLTPVAVAPLLIPASTVGEGEHLDQLVLRPGELNLGLLYMNRRHGEVVHRLFYRFCWSGQGLKLNDLYTTHFDRYVEQQEQRIHYSLETGRLSMQRFQFQDKTFLSEEQAPIPGQSPTMETLTPDWRPEKS